MKGARCTSPIVGNILPERTEVLHVQILIPCIHQSFVVWLLLLKQKTLCTVGLEELFGMQVALQHPFIEQHVAHGFRDDYVHLLG